MDIATEKVSQFIRERGYNLSEVARKTGIPYHILYASINDERRERDLRASEFLAICSFINEDPMRFKGEELPPDQKGA